MQVEPGNTALFSLRKQIQFTSFKPLPRKVFTYPIGEARVSRLFGEDLLPSLWYGYPFTGIFIVTPSLEGLTPKPKDPLLAMRRIVFPRRTSTRYFEATGVCGIGSPPTSVFIKAPSLGDCQKAEELSPAHETDLFPPEVNLVCLGLEKD